MLLCRLFLTTFILLGSAITQSAHAIAVGHAFQNDTAFFQQNPVVFEINEAKNDFGYLNAYTYVLEDSLNQKNFAQVRTSDDLKLYYPYLDSAGKFNHYSAYWIKMYLKSNLPEDSDWILSFFEWNSYIDLYTEEADGSFSLRKGGVLLPISEREFKKRGHAFSLQLPAGETRQVIAKIRRINNFVPSLGVTLYSRKYWEAQVNDITDPFLFGFLQGALWLVGCFFLIYFVTSRDKAYLYYAAFLFFVALYHLDNKFVYAEEWLLGDHMLLKPYFWILSFLQFVFFPLFVRAFINAPELAPKWDIVFKAMIGARILCMVVSACILFLYFDEALIDNLLITWLWPFEIICWLVLVPVYFIKGNKVVQIFLLGVVMYIFFTMLISDIILHTDLDDGYLKFIEPVGLVLQCLFFSSALGYRAYYLNLERDKAQQRYISQLQENERLQAQVNLRLEEKVKERTARIEMQNEALKRQSRKLKKLDSLKSRLFANISHEFRTPLTLILTPLQKMYEQVSEASLKRQYAMMIRNARNLLDLINQLLELSQHEAGELKLHLIQTDVASFVKTICASFTSLADSKNISYSCEIPEKEIQASFDPKKLKRIVENLLSNALKFTPDHGKVLFRLTEDMHQKSGDKRGFILLVEDSGIGIPKDKIADIYNRFYQIDSAYNRIYEGTGIGLALVKELVLLHHGTIEVESQEGKGTKFIIRLPLGKIQETQKKNEDQTFDLPSDYPVEVPSGELPVEEEHANHKKDRQDILVVEDNQDLRKYLSVNLRDKYHVMEAKNGNEGMILASNHIPDLIISDWMMPGLSGLDFCEKIKKNQLTSHIPIIMLTAKADHEAKIAGWSVGADDYITKPFELSELEVRIKNLLDTRKRLQEKYMRQMFSDKLSGGSKEPVDDLFLQKLEAVLEKHYEKPDLQVEELTRDLGMSRSQFYRKIRSVTGDKPNAFIRKFRLHRAAKLLEEEYGSVSMVSDAVGFNTDSYFSKCFQQEFGHLPSEHLDMTQKAR